MTGPADTRPRLPGAAVRQRLPQRRHHWLIDFEHDGHRYTAGHGEYEDGRPAEIFMNTAKSGAALDVATRDAAITASLLLQFGCPAETLRRALTRNRDGSAAGALGRFLDMLAAQRDGEAAG